MNALLFALIVLTNACGRVEVSSAGACVTSYVPAGERDVFFRSRAFEPGSEKFAHGGVPVCWPWFGRKDGSGSAERIHGFARRLGWKVRERSASRVVLTAESDETTRRFSPDEFRLTCAVTLGPALDVSVSMENTGTRPIPFTAGLHPFFSVSDNTRLRLRGVDGLDRIPSVIDRAFPSGAGRFELIDPGYGRTLEIMTRGADHVCVWNDYAQWPEVYASGGGREFCCVEPLVRRQRGVMESLAPGERRDFGFSVRVLRSGAGLEPALRPSSVPIVSCDPYFSIWSGGDAPNLVDTEAWHGARQPVSVEIELDGVRYRLLGQGHGGHSGLSAGRTWSVGAARSADLPALRCVRTEVRPLTTVYTFTDGRAQVRLSFMTPKMADELDVFSRPVTYATVETTGAKSVRTFAAISPALATNDDAAEMVTNRFTVAGMAAYSIGRKVQTPLSESGDCVRCNWGYACLVNPESEGTSAHFLLAYDDVKTLQFLGREIPAWWRRDGKSFETMLAEAEADRARLAAKADRFDADLSARLERVGGVRYRELAALAYRESFAACKLAAGPDGQPLYFSKENSSNGCIGTVDVFYPQLPLLLLTSAALTRATLEPIMTYAASDRWTYGYAPHDLGRWPCANAQRYGMWKGATDADRMPVEECGNMLIALAALADAEGSAAFADRFWPTVTKWAEYLEKFGFDPGDQLCTDDFAGHLAHNANLSVKTILAFASYAKLAAALGRTEAAAKYRRLAEEAVPRWMEAAKGGADGGYRLTFDRPGSWSQKYNLVWDRVLGFNLFPREVADAEMAAYRAQARPYGVPLDSRAEYTKTDWSLWCASLTGRREDLDFFTDLVWRFVDETPDRNPFSDLYWTNNGRIRGFIGRPVIGGVFMPLLAACRTAGGAADAK